MNNNRLPLLTLAASLALAACGGGGGGSSSAPAPEETRVQDTRTAFAPATPPATTFTALAPAAGDVIDVSSTSRWAGTLGNAAYRVEVPPNWNGKLVMYAHGYAGTGNLLTVQNPQIRRYLIANGYAWAASSYSKNYYDVRAGVEDTNALANAFTQIAADNGRRLTPPSRIYITGVSMGGHITAAAIEDEAYATANNKVRYNGAVPMCGVLGDTELFDYFGAAQVTAQALAGVPNSPIANWPNVQAQVTAALFTRFPATPVATTAQGAKYKSVLKNITGGERPIFELGLAYGGSFSAAYGVFGLDGTVNGILNKSSLDTNRFVYAIDNDPAGSAALNASAQKLTAAPDANRLRRDGLRWVPVTTGNIRIPVVTLHTLGDLYVPFSMEQIYQRRVTARGNGNLLVQRAIRGATHCDFTVAEQAEAFEAMVRWERDGVKPAGDDVVTASTVAQPSYGCRFTRNTPGADDTATTLQLRTLIASTTAPCPAQ